MKRSILPAALAVALLAVLAFVVHSRRSHAAREGTPPAPPPPDKARRDPPVAPPPPAPRSRADLLAVLEKLGRARLVRDDRTASALAAALPRLTEDDVPWLVAQAKTGELFAAAGAIELLRRFGRAEAVPVLSETLAGTRSVFLKDVAADALGAIGGSAAQSALLDALAAGPDGSVRARVALALGRFDGPEVYYALARALQDDRDPAVRRAAAEALARLPSQDAVRLFVERVARETDPGVQMEVLVGALEKGGDAALPALRDAVAANPSMRAALEEEMKRRGPHRYARAYAPGFFDPQPALPWTGRRIGITVEGGAALADVAAALFAAAPLDRYREHFYLRRADEFAADVAAAVPAPRACDARGVPIVSGVPRNDLDSTVFIHWRDPKAFGANVLGYTEGADAYVTPVSLLHEVGHALARLADEYVSPAASKLEAANLDQSGRPPKWCGLVEQGLLGAPAARGDGFVVPGAACHMNNRATDDRFCPVCQLELIARICELTGAPVPW